MKATDLRPGAAITIDRKLYVITKYDHTKPGKGPAYVQVKMKDVRGGNYIEKRFGSSDTVDGATLDRRDCEYLYSDGSGHIFMDNENYDQFTIDDGTLGDAMLYLRPNSGLVAMFHEENVVTIELPTTVVLKVEDTPPGIKGATVTNQLKEAKMETGLQTRVPPFIEIGEEIKINTADGSYMSRAKE